MSSTILNTGNVALRILAIFALLNFKTPTKYNLEFRVQHCRYIGVTTLARKLHIIENFVCSLSVGEPLSSIC